MKEKGLHEGCIEQMYRLFAENLYGKGKPNLDSEGRIRIDDKEMQEDVQNAVKVLWEKVSTENLKEISDFATYRSDFLKLFGFGFAEVNYDEPVDPAYGQ